MHKYVLYGLGVHTEVPLWGVESDECPAEVTISWRCVDLPDPPGKSTEPITRLTADGELTLSWPGIATMRILGGQEIVIETRDRDELNHVRHLIVGMGMGLLLHQRGVFTLHACAVAVGESALALAGPKGSGKSTMAAALCARGHTLLSDDVLALEMPAGRPPRVLPGPTTLNLWPDSAMAVGQEPEALPRIWSRSTKRISTLPGNGNRRDLPLKCIFFIENSTDSASVERLTPAEALPLLIGHSHALRIVEDRAGLPRHLVQCQRVATEIDLFWLRRPRSLEGIGALASMIERQMGFSAPTLEGVASVVEGVSV